MDLAVLLVLCMVIIPVITLGVVTIMESRHDTRQTR
jgi:hypothetical protein